MKRTWGGKRRGAGRKPKDPKRGAGVAHDKRPLLRSRHPVHVTLRMVDAVWNLRSQRSWKVIGRALLVGGDRFGFRVVDYAVQAGQIELLCEAENRDALSRGLQGLSVRIARGLNRAMGRKGRVLADRYHARILKTPSETRAALHAMLGSARVSERRGLRVTERRGLRLGERPRVHVDVEFTSLDLRFHAPRTWLLRDAWRHQPS